MSDGTSTIVLDADVSAYVNKMVKAGKATEEAFGKSKTHTESMTKAFEHFAAKALTVVASIQTINTGFQALGTFMDAQGKSNASAGARQLDLAHAASQLGLKGGSATQLGAWAQANSGAANTDARNAFINQLGAFNQSQPLGLQLKPDQIGRLQQAFATGGEAVFGKGGADLIAAAGRYPGAPEAGVRQFFNRRLGRDTGRENIGALSHEALSGMGDDALREVAQREYEGKLQTRLDTYGRSPMGQSQRRLDAARRYVLSTDPDAAVIDKLTPDAVRIHAQAKMAHATEDAVAASIEKQTRELREGQNRRPLPNLTDRNREAPP